MLYFQTGSSRPDASIKLRCFLYFNKFMWDGENGIKLNNMVLPINDMIKKKSAEMFEK